MTKAYRFSQQGQYLGLFLFYFIVWIAANWPALQQAWWSTDDYTLMLHYNIWHHMSLGRPIEALQHATLPYEYRRFGTTINIIMRYWQGILHCTVALSAAILLYRATKRPAIFISILLFLVWPFNGEAVLWRASALPLAACLSIIGTMLLLNGTIQNHRSSSLSCYIFGIFFIILGGLAHQLAVMFGSLVWVCLTLLRNELTWRQFLREAVGIGIAYLLAIGSTVVMIQYTLRTLHRATPTLDWQTKVHYLQALLENSLFIEYFPLPLQALHLLNLALAAGAIVYLIVVKPLSGFKLLGGFLVLLLLPFLPLLIIEESATAPRFLYLAPFILVVCLLILDSVFKRQWYTQWIVITVTLCTIILYFPISRQNADDFVRSFLADKQALAQIEAQIVSSQPTAPIAPITFAAATPPEYIRTWNPHELQYLWGDAKLSAYLVSWSVGPFTETFCSLPLQYAPDMNPLCTAQCTQSANGRPFYTAPLPDTTTYCICP